MKRFAAIKATVLLAASALTAAPAWAGDRAEIDLIGYSEDGKYFAFEEYGVQDGSGFPFSNIYVVDLETDSWVKGTPVRVLKQDEDVRLETIRAQAEQDVRTVLEDLAITAPAKFLALNGDGEPDAAAYSLRYGEPGYGLSDVRDERLLSIEVFNARSAEDCEIIDNATKGLALLVDGDEILRDQAPLPKSRGCPTDYRLYGVVAPVDFAWVDAPKVVIVSNYPFGFEGPDRRFLAIPLVKP